MGTYVTYMVSHLFDLPDMQAYAKNRLIAFYEYTLDNGGFSETVLIIRSLRSTNWLG